MKSNKSLTIVGLILLLVIISYFGITKLNGGSSKLVPTPTIAPVKQLTAEEAPKPSLTFSSDGHYVTVKIVNINAAELEYNLIYDAVVKKNQVNTGVTGSAKLNGDKSYSYKQLLGSESSGKFSYHEKITNAVMELTLRDANKYSVFSATYPFQVLPGQTIELSASE